jgi:hypothetical protein
MGVFGYREAIGAPDGDMQILEPSYALIRGCPPKRRPWSDSWCMRFARGGYGDCEVFGQPQGVAPTRRERGRSLRCDHEMRRHLMRMF